MLRVGEHVLDRPGLRHLAGVHDDQAVGDVAGARDVVRDVEEGDALAPAQRRHEVEHADAHGDVEHRDRLVGQDQLGPARERLRETDALPLPATQLIGVLVEEVLCRQEAHRFEQALGLLVPAAPAQVGAVELERANDPVRYAVDRAQRAVWILEDHRHVAAVREHIPARAQRRQRPSAVEDVAARRPVHHGDQPRERALPAAALADDGDDLVLVEAEVDVVDGVQPAARPQAAQAEVLGEADGAEELFGLGPGRKVNHRTGSTAPARLRERRTRAARSCTAP